LSWTAAAEKLGVIENEPGASCLSGGWRKTEVTLLVLWVVSEEIRGAAKGSASLIYANRKKSERGKIKTHRMKRRGGRQNLAAKDVETGCFKRIG